MPMNAEQRTRTLQSIKATTLLIKTQDIELSLMQDKPIKTTV